jgi:choline dehydrogenase-like flavoprotein
MAAMNDRQRRTLQALVDTYVPAIERDDDPTGFWATPGTAVFADIGVELYLSTLPEELQDGLLELLDGLGQFGLASQTQTMREITLRMLSTASPEAAMGLDALRQLTTLIAYGSADESGHNPLWAGLGYPGAPSPTPPAVEKTLSVLGVDAPTELTADAVIVGSGSGGGVVAAELAGAGLDVVVVEAGGYFNESDFNQQEMWAWQHLYYRSGPNPTADGNVTLLAGRALGGGTTVNWSNSVPPRDDIRKRWEDEHGLDGVAGDEFNAHVDAVMTRIGATEECSDLNGPHQRLVEGAEALGWKVRRAQLNLDPQRYDPEMAGHTGYGDQTGAKQGAYKTWLQDAADAGARLVVGTTVDRVLVEGGRAAGVTGTATDAFGGQHEVTVRAPIVVAACGALETPALLLRSEIGGPAVGHHLTLHPTGAIFGTYAQEQRAWWGPVQAAILHEFDDVEDGYGFIIEGTHFNPGLTGSAVPWNSGADHKELLSRTPRSATLIHLTQDRGGGQVVLGPDGEAVHLYPFADELDVRNFRRGLEATARIHEAAGAEEIACLVPGVEPWRRGQDLDAWLTSLRSIPVGAGGLAAFSAHQMGTARMGSDPATSVADGHGQLHDTPGVWVGDTSAFPTCSGVNPMVTCMALARRTAHAILAEQG